ncbi:unnamed protein product, partial [Polarella glacialis]
MGVPRLARWLQETFPDAFSTQTETLEADHVYIDMNAILHEVVRSLGAFATEEGFFRAVGERLDFLLEHVAIPRRSVFLAVDGPAAVAKVPEQRRRRRE